MQLGKFVKAPADRKRYTVVYSDWLDQSELVASAVYSVDPVSDTSPLVVDGTSIDTTSTGLVFYASGGEDGGTYRVTIIMTTSGGQIREDVVQYSVRAV